MSQPEIREQETNFNGNVNDFIPTELELNQTNTEHNSQGSNKGKGNSLIFGILIGIAISLVGMKFASNDKSQTNPTSVSTIPATEQTQSNNTQTITTAEVKVTSVETTISANGTVAAQELVAVMSQANGLQITEVLFDEGDLVSQGQTLVRLDDTILQAELKQAKAAVAQAEARLAELKAGTRQEELQRAREKVKFAMAEVLQAESDLQLAEARVKRNRQLDAEGAITRDRLDEVLNNQLTKKSNLEKARAKLREEEQQLLQLESGVRPEIIAQAEAALAEDEAKVNLIQAQLADTTINAPVSGKVAERSARVGNVTSGFNSRELLTIIEEGRLELQVKVPETQLTQIKIGQKVKVTSGSISNLNITGIVAEIDPTIDVDSRQGIVKVNLPNRDDLQPGMFLQAEIISNTKSSLTIPLNAVLPDNDGTGTVFQIQSDDTVKAQNVTLGEILDGDRIEIINGLSVGAKVAVKGVAYLQDGDKIKVVN